MRSGSIVPSVVLGSVLLLAAPALAFPPRATTATVSGVRLAGQAHSSSTGVSREPEYVIVNTTALPHVVELVRLESLGEAGARQPLTPRGTTHIDLPPHATRAIVVAYRGTAINSGGGLPYYRFKLTITVDGQSVSAIASNAYMCRIPIRRP